MHKTSNGHKPILRKRHHKRTDRRTVRAEITGLSGRAPGSNNFFCFPKIVLFKLTNSKIGPTWRWTAILYFSLQLTPAQKAVNHLRNYCTTFITAHSQWWDSNRGAKIITLGVLIQSRPCWYWEDSTDFDWDHLTGFYKMATSTLTHFSLVLHFIYKPDIWFAPQIGWLVSTWNTTLDWNGLSELTSHLHT